MFPFVQNLSIGLMNFHRDIALPDLRTVELITSSFRFREHRHQVSCHGHHRISMRLEPEELRMMAIALRLAAQDFLREQRFAPQRDQSFGIEIFWVQRPQAHREISPNFARPREA
jgi:hypothetical protein